MLELIEVSRDVAGEVVLDRINLQLLPGTLNVLLGPTLSGKTSLMRVMAGLDRPDRGDIQFNGRSVTRIPVQKRDVAMVYQQFINYPTLTVYENIASPLRVAKLDRHEIERRVGEAAELMKLGDYLQRYPRELSGGQQQRTALARALVKQASLVLLDEPLANLDYKLREELRQELPRIFAASGSILVYASTEPSEALLLGGNTATLCEGRITQFGPTLEVYRKPNHLQTAHIFSDPPLNTLTVHKSGDALRADGLSPPPGPDGCAVAEGEYTLGLRPHHLLLEAAHPRMYAVQARVLVSELTGSETFIHLDVCGRRWVCIAPGVLDIAVDSGITAYFDPASIYLFDSRGSLAAAPLLAPA